MTSLTYIFLKTHARAQIKYRNLGLFLGIFLNTMKFENGHNAVNSKRQFLKRKFLEDKDLAAQFLEGNAIVACYCLLFFRHSIFSGTFFFRNIFWFKAKNGVEDT